jgi:hypothetical protein
MFPVFPFDARNATVQNIIFLQPSKNVTFMHRYQVAKFLFFAHVKKCFFFSREEMFFFHVKKCSLHLRVS